MISLAVPRLGQEEKLALQRVIDSGWVTIGEQVRAFEMAFAKMHGVVDSVAVSSGTAGLHLSLAALNIKRGDKVLVPSLTFVATVNAILYVGATPVFVDIESLDLPHMSLEDAQEKITNDTKAVIVVHYAGYLVDLDRWRVFANKHKIYLIEDAAHAPGISPVGQIGDAAAFSFFGNKNMTTAEGGMVTAIDPETIGRIRKLRSHAMTTTTLDRHSGHAYSYDVTMLGYNYRMDELRAAIGLCQLTHLKEWNRQRRELVSLYRRLLVKYCPSVSVPFSEGYATAAHLLVILLPEDIERERVMTELRAAGIQSSIHYPPVHRFSYYQAYLPGVVLAVTEKFCNRAMTLPLYPGLDQSDVKKIVSVMERVVDGISRYELGLNKVSVSNVKKDV